MNKHLNNWMDKVEGKKPETTNNAIKKERKRQGYNNPIVSVAKQHAYVFNKLNEIT